MDDPASSIERARRAGVEAIITIGTDLVTSRRSIDLANEHPGVWAAVGVHPHEAKTFSNEAQKTLEGLAREERVVAVGESGLDFYRDLSPRDDQERVFRAHIALAKKLGLALVVHLRDAHEALFQTLSEEGPPEPLVFHAFSGGIEESRRALQLGGHLSFAGNLSYPKSDDLREAAGFAPLDRLLVETDSPYLPPVPHRGKRNEPSLVVRVGEVLAQVRGIASEQVAEATTKNARRIFLTDGNARS